MVHVFFIHMATFYWLYHDGTYQIFNFGLSVDRNNWVQFGIELSFEFSWEQDTKKFKMQRIGPGIGLEVLFKLKIKKKLGPKVMFKS
jgi:hypothetical protein